MLGRGGTGARPSRRCSLALVRWTETLGTAVWGPAACSALRRGTWNPLPVHSGAMFGGMKPNRTFPCSLLGGSGIREEFLLLGGC